MNTFNLKAPFIVGPHGMPALQIAGAWLTLEGIAQLPESTRITAGFRLDIPLADNLVLTLRDSVSSGVGAGFQSVVEPFATFVSMLDAAVDAVRVELAGRKSDNSGLFPTQVMEWAHEESDSIGDARVRLMDEGGGVFHDLITIASEPAAETPV